VLGYAAELEELSANSLARVNWKPPKVADVVDRRVVVNPQQARELLTAMTYVGRLWRGRHLRAFFACIYFAALRPAEVKALRKDGCCLPGSGWGKLTLSRSRPQSNKRWTDSGEAFDDRGLKHRAESDTRSVPIPPELVTILREHIEELGTAQDGRLFRTATGGMICDTTHTWAVARTLGLVPEQVASPLAARPYDLRHAAVSLWLNGGVAATDVANRAGHSVEVLLRVYAKCIEGGEEAANRRIDEALAV
jgi:integrase